MITLSCCALPFRKCIKTGVAGLAALAVARAAAGMAEPATLALTDLTLDQLMSVRIQVTTAARKAQAVEDTAAAIHVITAEDIRRSGLSRLPEILRLAPGLQVARIDGATWAISSRGFNAKNSDNLLVMMDGRLLHTPTFTGVYWNAQDVPVEEIERIEVVRGSGGALWGANAVAGVINIITRHAAASQGGKLTLGWGTHEHQGNLRYGGTLDNGGHYRVYARRIGQDDFERSAGVAANDRNHLRSAGFRIDLPAHSDSALTLQGDIYDGRSWHTGTALTLSPVSRLTTAYPITLAGSNLLARWALAGERTVQLYHDRYTRRYFNLGETRETVDVDFQQRLLARRDHDIVWGANYRRTHDSMRNTEIVAFSPSSRTDDVLSFFFQDDIALDGDKLALLLGARIERNDYTGVEVQPSVRLRWKPEPRQTAWLAVSSVTHTPSRNDADGAVVNTVVAGAPARVSKLIGNPKVGSERVSSLEAGWRFRPNERLSTELAAFFAEHRRLMTLEQQPSYMDGGLLILPLTFGNRAAARTQGIEWDGTWALDERWRLRASYTWLQMSVRRNPGSTDTTIESEEGRSPHAQAQFHASYAVSAHTDLGVSVYRVAGLRSLSVPAYTRVDARLAWRPQPGMELALVGQNLIDPGHVEFVSPSGPRNTEIPRALMATLSWRY